MANGSPINLKEVGVPIVTNEDLQKLLQENLRLTQEVHDMTHKIKSYVTFQKVLSFVYLILIFGPIILGFFFIQPYLKDVLGQYKSILGQYNQLLNPSSPGAIMNSGNSGLLNNK
jgi:hypothetical protein